MPQPSALTMSCSSLLPATLSVEACSALSTLPRSGRIAWVWRSRPCLAEPPAESPSTMNSSLSSGSVDEQSASLPGRFSRWLTAVLRVTAWLAARDASRARAARMMRADDRLGDGLVVVEPLLERRPHHAVDLALHLGVVEPVLGLALELRLDDVGRQDARPCPRGCPRR